MIINSLEENVIEESWDEVYLKYKFALKKIIESESKISKNLENVSKEYVEDIKKSKVNKTSSKIKPTTKSSSLNDTKMDTTYMNDIEIDEEYDELKNYLTTETDSQPQKRKRDLMFDQDEVSDSEQSTDENDEDENGD